MDKETRLKELKEIIEGGEIDFPELTAIIAEKEKLEREVAQENIIKEIVNEKLSDSIFSNKVYQKLGLLIQQINDVKEKQREMEKQLKNLEVGMSAVYACVCNIEKAIGSFIRPGE